MTPHLSCAWSIAGQECFLFLAGVLGDYQVYTPKLKLDMIMRLTHLAIWIVVASYGSANVCPAQIPGATLRGPTPNPAKFQSPDFGHWSAAVDDATGVTVGFVTTGDLFSGSSDIVTLEYFETNGQKRWTRNPPPEISTYAVTVFAGVPDLDGDTIPDLLVGTSIFGYAELLSGASGTRIELIQNPTPLLGVDFGSKVTSLGDMDGDGAFEFTVEGSTGLALYRFQGGVSQFVIFLPGVGAGSLPGPGGVTELVVDTSFETRFYHLSGSTLILSRTYSKRALECYGVRDVSGDGRDDLLMNSGTEVWMLDGATLNTLWSKTSSGHTLSTGFSADKVFGFGLATGQDLNGNGTPDVAVGDFYHMASNPAKNEGAIFVYEGATGVEIGVIFGVTDNSWCGENLAMVSTFLGNGVPTLLSGMNNPFGFVWPTTHPGEIRSYTVQPAAVAPVAQPVLQIDRIGNMYTVSGGPPNSVGYLGASLSTTTFGGVQVVDIFSSAALIVIALPFSSEGVMQAPLPVSGSPTIYVQVIDNRGVLSQVTEWKFY